MLFVVVFWLTSSWLPRMPPHIGTRPRGLWSPAAASQRSAGGAGGMLTTSTWSSPLPRPAPWTAAPASTFPTAATPMALTCLILTLVRARTQPASLHPLTHSLTYCRHPHTNTHFQLSTHLPQHTERYFHAEVWLSARKADTAVLSDLLGPVWSSWFKQTHTDHVYHLCQTDPDGRAWMKHLVLVLIVYLFFFNYYDNDLSAIPLSPCMIQPELY